MGPHHVELLMRRLFAMKVPKETCLQHWWNDGRVYTISIVEQLNTLYLQYGTYH